MWPVGRKLVQLPPPSPPPLAYKLMHLGMSGITEAKKRSPTDCLDGCLVAWLVIGDLLLAILPGERRREGRRNQIVLGLTQRENWKKTLQARGEITSVSQTFLFLSGARCHFRIRHTHTHTHNNLSFVRNLFREFVWRLLSLSLFPSILPLSSPLQFGRGCLQPQEEGGT